MPNRSMQAKAAKAGRQKIEAAVDLTYRTLYRDPDAPPQRLNLSTLADAVASHRAKLQAARELSRATREALGKRTAWAR